MSDRSKVTAFCATPAEHALLCWLTAHLETRSLSDTIRRLLLDASRHQGAPARLRQAAIEQREQHPPRKSEVGMIEPDELQQRVLDLSGKDSGK